MTDVDVAETEAGLTALDLDPEALAPIAWTVDNIPGDDGRAHRWRRWLLPVGAVTAASAALVAVGLLALDGYRLTTTTPKPTTPKPSVSAAAPTSPFAALSYDPIVATVPVPEAQRDGVYLDMLKKGGFTFPDGTADKTIRFSRNSCARMREGLPSLLIDQALIDGDPAKTGYRTDLSPVQRRFVVNMTIGIYCPELMAR